MAYATPRSCRDALKEGATDGGIWKSATAERGGIVTSPTNQHQTTPAAWREPMRGMFGSKGEC